MSTIAQALRLSIAPLFFILAAVNFQLESHAPMSGHAAMGHGGGASAGVTNIIVSMGLMYALMGLAHITPWLSLSNAKKSAIVEEY